MKSATRLQVCWPVFALGLLGCNELAGIRQAQSGDLDSGYAGSTGDMGSSATSGYSEVTSGGASGNTETSGSVTTPPTDASTTLHPWADWPMPNPPSTNIGPVQSYDAATAGIVFDNVTGLTWQENVAAAKLNWNDALSYCATLALAGGGWRLPSRIELLSLVDYTQLPATIDPVTFPSTPTDAWFWSGSLYAVSAAYAWNVDFGFVAAPSQFSTLDKLGYVRCVR